MSYLLNQNLQSVTGIGPALAAKFASKNIHSVKDLLLFLPLRYEDRSQIFTIVQVSNSGESSNFITIRAKVNSTSNYYKGRRSIQSASISDETGKLKLMWFNNPWIIKKLTKDKEYIFSGKISERGVMMQAVAEELNSDNIHTGRLVPIYSSLDDIKQGTLRRILKNVVDSLVIPAQAGIHSLDPSSGAGMTAGVLDLHSTLTQLHFPETQELVIQARERLALEELLSLIEHSNKIKSDWQKRDNAIAVDCGMTKNYIPDSIPFELTKTQKTATQDILADISKNNPMNRLLIGDVGSGKTVVAGIACHHVIKNGQSACLIAPTQILAEQHVETFQKLFPHIKINLITGKTKYVETHCNASLHIGTHALINKLDKINPALIIYDEQHKFGVSQRSVQTKQDISPHVLTMSATPIPRSLMLTIFSHLSLSNIDEMPPGRKPVKTWAITQKKRQAAYQWIFDQLSNQPSPLGEELESETCEDTRGEVKRLAIVVTPFINPSDIPGFEQIASATTVYEELAKHPISQSAKIALLHGKLKTSEKDKVTQDLFKQKIDILLTTPVIEVGLDLPNADIVLIESAQRFGLASLHQLRGRVGRAGQDSFCIVVSSSGDDFGQNNSRLTEFSKENNGMKLAQKDLQRRGAGNLFGIEQSGFDQLKFANWANLELLAKARLIFEQIENNRLEWNYFFETNSSGKNDVLAAN